MSRFDNTLAEAAYMVAGHGFALYEEGTVEEADGWNALVTVSLPVLLNIDASEFFCSALLAGYPEVRNNEVLVWVQEDSQGFVSTPGFGDHVEQDWLRLYDYSKE